ncbi:uncharacterized protein LOC126901595 [Daktulosphaira vitifoliae]|uniref:uncharacterized protein LOC126901595 n=1 Tax=Daktulosphaira vitifoliae TaxID=58002 RepID=UPI0021A9C5A0|nr:uncharacterized protein LOC126901595 [Daktulosphaira vitifoliae]
MFGSSNFLLNIYSLLILFLLPIFLKFSKADHEDNPSLSKDIKKCSNNYTMFCVKKDILLYLDKFNEERSYELFPGFTIHQSRLSNAVYSNVSQFDKANFSDLDSLISKRIYDYIESVDIRVKLISPMNSTTRSISASFLERVLPFFRMSRKKKDQYGVYWAAATMATLGGSALLALSSKALMTAGAALAFAIYSNMKGGSGGKGGGSLTATLMEESALVPQRQCAEALVDLSGHYQDIERYPGSRKAVEIVSPKPVYRIQTEDYSSPSYNGASSSYP